MFKRGLFSLIIAGCMITGSMTSSAVKAQQISNDVFQTNVNITILPYAELEFTGGNLLYLLIPPPDSTIPSTGVNFIVRGNATATLSAEPDDFIWIPSENSFMGKAVIGSEEIGYRIELRFPSVPMPGSPPQYAWLPGFEQSGTSPLSVNLTLSSGARAGVIHMEASQEWTPDGAFPLPGIYEGEIVLTLTADNV